MTVAALMAGWWPVSAADSLRPVERTLEEASSCSVVPVGTGWNAAAADAVAVAAATEEAAACFAVAVERTDRSCSTPDDRSPDGPPDRTADCSRPMHADSVADFPLPRPVPECCQMAAYSSLAPSRSLHLLELLLNFSIPERRVSP
uniref:Putative secreted protein n=1 Tax=Anopheles darlingi TaxID=43151 RepID=A0A2M4D310_ANODA